MKIEFEQVAMQINNEEAIDLYYALKREIERSIKEHWINYPLEFEKQSASKLHMLRQLHRIIDHEPFEETLKGFKVLCGLITTP
jgi:hypothetical protein